MSNGHSKGNKGAIMEPAEQQKLNPNAIIGAWLQPYPLSLYPKLVSLNVTHYTRILSKTLERTDLEKCEGRLLLTSRKVASSPLLNLLTSDELASVHQKSGLKVRVWDESGIEYNMVLKFLQSNSAYRMIRQWSQFLRWNDGKLQAGDEIEICAFRIPKGSDSEIGMVLLHREKDRDLYRDRDGEDEYRAVKRSLKVKGEEMEVSQEEWIAVEALVQLQGRM